MPKALSTILSGGYPEQNVFTTISVSGQSDVVADTTQDTLENNSEQAITIL